MHRQPRTSLPSSEILGAHRALSPPIEIYCRLYIDYLVLWSRYCARERRSLSCVAAVGEVAEGLLVATLGPGGLCNSTPPCGGAKVALALVAVCVEEEGPWAVEINSISCDFQLSGTQQVGLMLSSES